MKYSIIIPTYNKLNKALKPCLESLVKYTTINTEDVEVIVVANGCTDGTKAYVQKMQKKFPTIKLIESAKPLGYTKATNKGIKVSKGEYVILLNNDTEFLDQPYNTWIDQLTAPFLADKKVGITGPMQINFAPNNRDFLIFFCVMIKRSVIDKIGILDEIFSPGYGEDIDYCFRAEKAGFKIVQVPENCNTYSEKKIMTGDFPIYHKGTLTFRDDHANYEKCIERNTEVLKERWPSDKPFVKSKAIRRKTPKIFDCFMFNNELDILDIRFNELYDTVDRFVIVESMFTHTGKQKDLVFNANLERYAKFLNKVTYLVVDTYIEGDAWARERHQRDYIMNGLTECIDNDIIICGDADEIIKASTLKKYKVEKGILSLEQQLYYYNFNTTSVEPWGECKIIPFKKLKELTPCGARYNRKDKFLKDGGWHFSYMGGVNNIKDKLKSFAHTEYNKPQFLNSKKISESIEAGKDILGRNIKYKIGNDTTELPEYVQSNLQEWIDKGYLKTKPNANTSNRRNTNKRKVQFA